MALVVPLLAACTDQSSVGTDPTGTDPGTVTSYVALGDSFTAAPYVPTTDLADGCFHSDGNYPSLVAAQLEPARFVDVSCSGAGTDNMTQPQATAGGRGRVPPQLRVVTPDTEVVSIGIGANDEGLFGNLVTQCASETAQTLCTDALLEGIEGVVARTQTRVETVIRRVSQRAPDATVIVVGYPRLVDPQLPCDLIPVPAERLDTLADIEGALNEALRTAAEDADASFVDMASVSRGHEICSADPWVNGRRTDEQTALAFHPFASEQRAVADQLLDILEAP